MQENDLLYINLDFEEEKEVATAEVIEAEIVEPVQEVAANEDEEPDF